MSIEKVENATYISCQFTAQVHLDKAKWKQQLVAWIQLHGFVAKVCGTVEFCCVTPRDVNLPPPLSFLSIHRTWRSLETPLGPAGASSLRSWAGSSPPLPVAASTRSSSPCLEKSFSVCSPLSLSWFWKWQKMEFSRAFCGYLGFPALPLYPQRERDIDNGWMGGWKREKKHVWGNMKLLLFSEKWLLLVRPRREMLTLKRSGSQLLKPCPSSSPLALPLDMKCSSLGGSSSKQGNKGEG